ncbi:Hypothetical predicted protein [Cloeon dipterum]|uniref:Uncharacterized protein n=1 Tax=Cloeon dipterum TaxID=197152 RepID=A0A8S1CW71_9INSE|nr:Hypothetical predicted protein [Cloeon dipterum]
MEFALKLCVVFALMEATQLTPLEDQKKKSMMVLETCRKEHQIPDGPLPELKEDSPRNLMCLVKCVMEGNYNKSISDIDSLHSEYQKRLRFLGVADEEFFTKEEGVYSKCKDVTKNVSDDCEKAAKLMLCVDKVSKTDGVKNPKTLLKE